MSMCTWTVSIRRVFLGTLKGLSKGDHRITVKGATKDHDLVTATHTITVEVE